MHVPKAAKRIQANPADASGTPVDAPLLPAFHAMILEDNAKMVYGLGDAERDSRNVSWPDLNFSVALLLSRRMAEVCIERVSDCELN